MTAKDGGKGQGKSKDTGRNKGQVKVKSLHLSIC